MTRWHEKIAQVDNLLPKNEFFYRIVSYFFVQSWCALEFNLCRDEETLKFRQKLNLGQNFSSKSCPSGRNRRIWSLCERVGLFDAELLLHPEDLDRQEPGHLLTQGQLDLDEVLVFRVRGAVVGELGTML